MRAAATLAGVVGFGGFAVVLGWRPAQGRDPVGQLGDSGGQAQPSELWLAGQQDIDEVPCGFGRCDCQWATADFQGACGQALVARTPCWSCCCSRLCPDLYHQASNLQGSPLSRGDEDHGGDRVLTVGSGAGGSYVHHARWEPDSDDGWRVGEDEWFSRSEFTRDRYFRQDGFNGDRYHGDFHWGNRER